MKTANELAREAVALLSAEENNGTDGYRPSQKQMGKLVVAFASLQRHLRQDITYGQFRWLVFGLDENPVRNVEAQKLIQKPYFKEVFDVMRSIWEREEG